MWLWPLTLKNLSPVPTHTRNICSRCYWNPSTKYRDIASREIGVDGQWPNRWMDGQWMAGRTTVLHSASCRLLLVAEALSLLVWSCVLEIADWTALYVISDIYLYWHWQWSSEWKYRYACPLAIVSLLSFYLLFSSRAHVAFLDWSGWSIHQNACFWLRMCLWGLNNTFRGSNPQNSPKMGVNRHFEAKTMEVKKPHMVSWKLVNWLTQNFWGRLSYII